MKIRLNERQITFFAIISLIVVGFIIYSNTFKVPFYFDDADNIENPSLRLDEISMEKASLALSGGTLSSRPVSNFSFALNYFFNEYRVQGYHLVNIFIHVCASIFLFLLIKNTLSLSAVSHKYPHQNTIACFSALIWLVHPVGTQSVTYIVQRMNSMAAMFYVLALLLYVIGRSWPREGGERRRHLHVFVCYILSFVCGLLALGSKEIAATLPLTIFIYEWFFIQDLSVTWIKRKVFWIAGTLGGVVLFAWVYTGGHLIQRTIMGYSGRDFTLEERLWTQLRVVVHYLGLLLYPAPDRLVFDYDFPLSFSLFNPLSTLFAGLLIGFLIFFACVFARRERILSFCIFWFFINLLIESTIVPLEMVFEHRTYLPSMFLVLFVVCVAHTIIKKKGVATFLLLSVMVLFGYWTVERNRIWADPVEFWSDSVQKYPKKPRSHNNLGCEYYAVKNYKEAERHFRVALSLKPDFPEPMYNIGLLYFRMGKIEEAEQLFLKAIALRPHYVSARLGLAGLYRVSDETEKAITQYESVYGRFPDYSVVNFELGQALLRKNEPLKSLKYLEKAYLRKPKDLKLLLAIGEAHLRLGNMAKSIEKYEEVIELDPVQLGAQYNLALLYAKKGDDEKARLHYQTAYVIQPEVAPIAYNFGNIMLRSGKLDKAEEAFTRFLQNRELVADAYNNLGLVYVGKGKYNEALQNFLSALRVNPGHALAEKNSRLVQDIINQGK